MPRARWSALLPRGGTTSAVQSTTAVTGYGSGGSASRKLESVFIREGKTAGAHLELKMAQWKLSSAGGRWIQRWRQTANDEEEDVIQRCSGATLDLVRAGDVDDDEEAPGHLLWCQGARWP